MLTCITSFEVYLRVFHNTSQNIVENMGFLPETSTKQHLLIHQLQGAGWSETKQSKVDLVNASNHTVNSTKPSHAVDTKASGDYTVNTTASGDRTNDSMDSINKKFSDFNSDSNGKNTADPIQQLPICTSQQRLQHIKKYLDLLGNGYKQHQTWHWLVNDAKKLIYCPILKIASSTLIRLMAIMTEKGRRHPETMVTDMHVPKHLSSFGLRVISNISELDTIVGYRKFIVLRHPYDRLVSAYNDRVLRNQYHADIVHRALNSTEYITFSSFIDAILLHGAFNDHWMPYADACMLRHIDYDDVIRVESFQHDIQPVLDYTGMTLEDILSPTVTTHSLRLKNTRTKTNQTKVANTKLQVLNKNRIVG